MITCTATSQICRPITALFVDTGALVGRVLPRDQHHRNSRNGWEMLKNIPVKLFSSEHVLDESVSRLSRQAGADYAVRWGREHLASREIEWLNTTPADWQEPSYRSTSSPTKTELHRLRLLRPDAPREHSTSFQFRPPFRTGRL